MGLSYFEGALSFYRGLEEKWNTSFICELPLKRIYSDVEEYNRWTARQGETPYSDFLSHEMLPEEFVAPHGVGMVACCARLDVLEFLRQSRKSLGDGYSEASFDYTALHRNEYQSLGLSVEFKQVIFCEGLGVRANPLFDYLPFKPAKGDVLTVRPETQFEFAVNKKKFMVQNGKGTMALGSTYDWKTDDPSPSESAKKELLESAGAFYSKKLVVEDHRAGIRPASFDRRPFVGRHAEQENRWVLNGMGSKACMLAPNCAQILFDHISNGVKIPKEMDVRRADKFI